MFSLEVKMFSPSKVCWDQNRTGYSYLNKDSEEDDSDDGSEEHLSHGKVVLIQQEAKGEGDGTSEATVRHNELVLGCQLDDAELVDHVGQTNHTWGGNVMRNLRLGLFVRLCVHVADLGQTAFFLSF